MVENIESLVYNLDRQNIKRGAMKSKIIRGVKNERTSCSSIR